MATAWAPTITRLPPARVAALLGVLPLLKRLIEAYPQATIAALLGVNKSAVNHWITEKREISPEMRGRIIELHDVLSRVHQVFSPTLASRWLTGHEPLLGGARPIDVIAVRGAAPIIDALDAIAAGGFS